MRLFFADQHAAHDCAGEMKDGVLTPCYENPRRLENVAAALKEAGIGPLEAPGDAGMAPILAVHDADYVAFLQTAHAEWRAAGRTGDVLPLVWPSPELRRDVCPQTIDGKVGLYCFDAGTPICAGTWEAAYQGAQAAIAAADAVSGGERLVFAAIRPPGHHAMPARYGGYCFLATAAIAAERLRAQGAGTVAVLDIDYHHGNGTQTVFYDRADVHVVNIHADPISEYPYFLGHADEKGVDAGIGATLNLPLPKGADARAYAPALDAACAHIARSNADALVLSFGADTYKDDPLGRFKLATPDYTQIGKTIAALDLPTAVILEGGYAIDALGDNTAALLAGLSGE